MKQKIIFLIGLIIFTAIAFIACKKHNDDTGALTPNISSLNCTSSTFSTSATINVAYSGLATVPYNGGNGVAYPAGNNISSTGVTGLTAKLSSGILANGNGNLTYTISGTPTSSGLASFAISFAGQSCSLNLIVNNGSGASATISAYSCTGTVFSSNSTVNVAYSGTASVPYTGGNGIAYNAGTGIPSSGVTGLTATLVPGTLANGSGSFIYNITGTPTSSGTATFPISFSGQSCNLSLVVNTASTSGCTSLSGVAKLICLCDAFKATLSATQLAQTQLSYTFSNIKTWSNLPASMSARIGIPFSSLNATQLTAAKAIVQEMTGTTVNEGWDEVQQLWLADDYLFSHGGGNAYGSGNYYLAFFGTPAQTGQFEIMMTGHHKTVANTYNNGVFISGTPHFEAVEPLTWTTNNITYAPINQEQLAFAAIINGLTSTQYTTAHSTSTFSDLVLGPNGNWSFPATSTGLLCSNLTSAQKTLVMNAIKTYTNDVDDASASMINSLYESELNNTYILHSGTTSMNTRNDYFRIDGPHVWIEFSVQNGIVMSGVHYHSVWRDRVNDYGTTH